MFPTKETKQESAKEEMPSRAVTHHQPEFSPRSFSVANQRRRGTFSANMGLKNKTWNGEYGINKK